MTAPGAAVLLGLLVLAAPSRAEDPRLKSLADSWKTGWEDLAAWDIVWFIDENGGEQRLFVHRPDLPDKTVDAAGVDVPLFKLGKPKLLKMDGDAGRNVQIAAFETNELSPYYVSKKDSHSTSLWISRKDKPGLLLEATTYGPWWSGNSNARSWYTEPDIIDFEFRRTGNDNHEVITWPDDKPYYQIQVYAPSAMAAAPAGPMTGTLSILNHKMCGDFAKGYYKPLDDGFVTSNQVVFKGLTPLELEALFVASSLGSNFVVNPALMKAATDELEASKMGKYDAANVYVTQQRAMTIILTDQVFRNGLPSALENQFRPLESNWLVCRMNHAGEQAAKDFHDRITKIAADDKAVKAFVAYWRDFLKDEFELYNDGEAKLKAELPKYPDAEALDAALVQRTLDAVKDQASAKYTPKKKAAAAQTARRGGSSAQHRPNSEERIHKRMDDILVDLETQ